MQRGHEPAYTILADDADITREVRDRLLLLSFEDIAEDRADRLTLRLDNRPKRGPMAGGAGFIGPTLDLPEPDTKLTVALGWADGDFSLRGEFRVDEIHLDGPPHTLEVRASSTAFSRRIRDPVTRTWHPGTHPTPDYTGTLGSMAEIVARLNDLEAVVAPGIANAPVQHEDQEHESDVALINRVAERFDAVARPQLFDKLVVVPRGQALTATGEPLPDVTIRPQDVTSYAFERLARRDPGRAPSHGVRAWYIKDEKRIPVTVGEPPFEDVPYPYWSERAARSKALSTWNQGDRRRKELHLDMPGCPGIVAEGTITLIGWPPTFPLKWRVLRVNHQIDSAGFTTSVRCELLSENRRDVSAEVQNVPPSTEEGIAP